MASQTTKYPSDISAATFLLTVRGTIAASSAEEARGIHNMTAGNPAGVEAARSLGDLSHNVYVGMGSEHEHELLFLDYWNSLSGLGQFFSDPQVQQGAGMLFSTMDNPVWVAAADFGSFHLAIPSGKTPAGVGLLRAKVSSVDKAAAAFRDYASATINPARRHGIVSHSLWIKAVNEGETPEIVGLDLWLDADAMAAYYKLSLGFEILGPVFAGAPDETIWRAAPGEWIEW
jgi:hypothetical protein